VHARRPLGPSALCGHLLVELGSPVVAHGDALGAGVLGGELHREAERVVEDEQLGSGEAGVPIAVQLLEALAQGAPEGLLLLGQDGDDVVLVLLHLGVVDVVDAGDRRDDLGEEVLVQAEVEGEADGAADESSHDVALGLVARPHSVDGEEGRTAQVVGDDAHGERLVLVGAPRQLLEPLDDGSEQADPEDVGRVDGGGGDALEPAPVVDVAARQRLEAGLRAAVLHEDGVAELDEPPAVAVLVAVRAVGGVVLDVREEVEDLGVGSAGLTDRHVIGRSLATPPVLHAVEGDSRAAGADLGCVLLGVDLDLVGTHPCLGEELRPEGGRPVVLGYAVGGVSDEAGDIDAGGVQTDGVGEETPELG
jgi:hypothetical protein